MKIAITRLRGKDTDDSRRCAEFGHTCYSVSPLKAEIHQDRIDEFIREVDAGRYDCIFFTSALPAQIIAPRLVQWPRVVAIGPQTAGILRTRGISCEVLPRFYSRDFVPFLGSWIEGKRIGIPRADVPNDALMASITDAGGIPMEIRCYSLVPTNEPLEIEKAEAVLFTSAFSFRSAIWNRRPELVIVAIGDITAKEMEDGGCPPHVVGNGSLEGTLKALNFYIQKNRPPDGEKS
jgi:uroporphyrinogen-III synthase